MSERPAWFSEEAHPHYGPCDGFADGDCSECRRMAYLCRQFERDLRAAQERNAQLTANESGLRDWQEDFAHENGKYSCRCVSCGFFFLGHKRRVVCRLCASQEREKSMIPEELAEEATEIMIADLDERGQASLLVNQNRNQVTHGKQQTMREYLRAVLPLLINGALVKLQERHEAERADLDILATVIRTGAVPPSGHEWTDETYRKSALRAVSLHRPRNLEESEMARSERTAAVAEALERAVQVADSEEEPAEGEIPPSIINSVLAQDTVAVERAIIAAVRATKKNIAANIRSLKPRSDMVLVRDGCPCLVIGPCSYACTCVNPVMSGGCNRCAKYGSDEQRRKAAQYIADALAAAKEGK